MELLIATPDGSKSTEKREVSDMVFGREFFNEPLVHQVVNAHLARARSGTHKQKTRSEVSGGGRKPFKQKGTGRARAGTIRSPIWRGGGKAFAAVPNDYSQKVNKKMYKAAMQSILSELVRQDRLVLVDNLNIDLPKTKHLISKLEKLNVKDALLIIDKWDTNLYLAARNMSKIDIREANKLDPVSLLRYETIVMTKDAISKVDEVLK